MAIEIIRLTPQQSAERKRRRSMDIWPDVARFTTVQAIETVIATRDPLMLSLFCDHRSAIVRRAASEKLTQVRIVAGRKVKAA